MQQLLDQGLTQKAAQEYLKEHGYKVPVFKSLSGSLFSVLFSAYYKLDEEKGHTYIFSTLAICMGIYAYLIHKMNNVLNRDVDVPTGASIVPSATAIVPVG